MNSSALEKLTRNGKAFFLAYDQGMEHGPTDFNEKNVDPAAIIHIANEAGVFTGIVFQEGVAKKYYPIGGVDKPNFPPLIVKLNGKTSLHPGVDPYSPQLCTVAQALKIGATGVGYTIYLGSEHEAKMMAEFSLIEDEAHAAGLGVILWMYPRGKSVEGKETSKDVVAYGARVALELGADIVKIPYTGDPESFKWVVESAGKTLVVVQGGKKKATEGEVIDEVKDFMLAGAAGMAVGRNVWQSEDPIGIAKKIAQEIYE
ncbi:MAG: aldolase [Patescibacteria group bacterium]